MITGEFTLAVSSVALIVLVPIVFTTLQTGFLLHHCKGLQFFPEEHPALYFFIF
jgi:hypothetical protein